MNRPTLMHEASEFLTIKGACQDILAQKEGRKKKIKAMEALLPKVKYVGSRKYVKQMISEVQSDVGAVIGLCVMFLIMTMFVVIGIAAATSSRR